MKIVEYTLGVAPFRRGGLPRYSTDLSEELAKKNDVYVLYPGHNTFINNKVMKITEKSSKYSFRLFEISNSLPVSLGLGINEAKSFMEERDIRIIERWFSELKPDVLHLHTLMGIPKDVIESVKKLGIKVVFTTHDFYGLCPKMIGENPKEKLKHRKCSYDCMLCKDGPSKNKMAIMQSHMYEKLKDSYLVKKIRKNQKNNLNDLNIDDKKDVSDEEVQDRFELRKYYYQMFELVDEFHFNSTVSQEYIKKFLPNIIGKVIPITHANLIDNRNKRKYDNLKKLKIGYVGPYDQKKGFFQYIKLLENIREKNQNFEAYFYGDISEHSFFEKSWVHNKGIQSEQYMSEIYQSMDLLVVPSLWHETFGFVVLESLLQGTPVLVSDNVGAKDLVPNDNIFSSDIELENKIVSMINGDIKKYRNQIKNVKLVSSMSRHVELICQEMYE